MGLLKDFLRIEADRRGALAALRLEAQSRRLQIEEIGAEAKRKRDEVAMIEEGLRRLAEDVARTEEQLLEIESRREDHDREAHERKIEAVRSSLEYDRADGHRISEDFRHLRSAFETERARLLAEADTGRMMDNFFQIEAFLKDTGTPIPDAARKALMKERQDLMGRIGPLVAPPPAPEGVFKATIVYSALEDGEPAAIVAVGLPDEAEPSGAHDLPALLLYGSYASVVEKIGPGVPRPRREEGRRDLRAACRVARGRRGRPRPLPRRQGRAREGGLGRRRPLRADRRLPRARDRFGGLSPRRPGPPLLTGGSHGREVDRRRRAGARHHPSRRRRDPGLAPGVPDERPRRRGPFQDPPADARRETTGDVGLAGDAPPRPPRLADDGPGRRTCPARPRADATRRRAARARTLRPGDPFPAPAVPAPPPPPAHVIPAPPPIRPPVGEATSVTAPLQTIPGREGERTVILPPVDPKR